MEFYNINDKSETASFNEAVMRGAAGGKGMYFPVDIPVLNTEFFRNISQMDIPELAYEVLKHFSGDDLSENELRRVCREVFQFPLPVTEIEDNVHVLELFHGPSLSFKDVGTRFLAGLLRLYVEKYNSRFTVLVATSGDTGSAVAKSLYDVPGVDVVLLYPKGKVSTIQEKTLSTFDKNVYSLEIDGSFDDCQRLVKSAFNDPELREKLTLTSANSINIARFLPQSIYYFKAWGDLNPDDTEKVCISVPSGNYGNLTGGMIARRMGLPVSQYIAASNVNRVVPDYLDTGNFTPRDSVQTLSNAMDVGNPSNFIRIRELFGYSHEEMTKVLKSFVADDDKTRQTIRDVYQRTGYILDPHGAIGYGGCKTYLPDFDKGIFLATAHPAKFKDTVEESIQKDVPIPENLSAMIHGEKRAISFSSDYEAFKDWLKTELSAG